MRLNYAAIKNTTVPAVVFFLLISTIATMAHAADEQEEVFSGPQVGEKVAPFKVRRLLEDGTVTDWSPVEAAGDRVGLLVFLHEVTRPSVALTRTVVEFAHKRGAERTSRSIILLASDPTDGEASLKRSGHAFPKEAVRTISLDGKEGPGGLGLNRKVAVTILVTKAGRVTANFALIQPSIQVDGLRIATAIVEALGDRDRPTQADVTGNASAMSQDEVRTLMRPLINKEATDEQVEQAAKAIEEAMAKSPAMRDEIYRIASTIVNSGKLENYGVKAAQRKLEAWAEQSKARRSTK